MCLCHAHRELDIAHDYHVCRTWNRQFEAENKQTKLRITNYYSGGGGIRRDEQQPAWRMLTTGRVDANNRMVDANNRHGGC